MQVTNAASIENERIVEGRAAARNSALTLLALSIIKGAAGMLSGSIALTADAVHSLTDVVSSLAVWLGLKISDKKPDEKFSYGYYKAENFASLVVSAIILLTGVGILRESVFGLLDPNPIRNVGVAAGASLVSAFTSFLLLRYKMRVGERINSLSLIADAKNSGSDIWSSLVVFAGVAATGLGIPRLEPLAGIIVSLFIFRTVLELARESMMVLLDACVNPGLRERAINIAYGVPGVKNVHNVRLRRAGMFVFGEAHIEVEEDETVEKAHERTTIIEQRIKNEAPDVERFTIHVEPVKKTSFIIALPADADKGLDSPVGSHFGKSRYYVLVKTGDSDIGLLEVCVNPAAELSKKIGLTAAKFLIEKDVDILISPAPGEGAFYALHEFGVNIYLPGAKTAVENARMFLDKKLGKASEPIIKT